MPSQICCHRIIRMVRTVDVIDSNSGNLVPIFLKVATTLLR